MNPDEAVSLGAAVLAGTLDGSLTNMQVMSSWQAALYRAFYGNYKENPSSIEKETNIEMKTEITKKLDIASTKELPTSTISLKNSKDKKKDSFLLKKLLSKKML